MFFMQEVNTEAQYVYNYRGVIMLESFSSLFFEACQRGNNVPCNDIESPNINMVESYRGKLR